MDKIQAKPIDGVDVENRVIVKFLKANGHYFPGDLAGFDAVLAANLVSKKIAVYQNGAPAQTEIFAAAQPADDPGKVEIPDDWERLHHLTRHRLAVAIAGEFVVPEDKKPMDVADDIIRSELARRAAAKNPPAQTEATVETGATDQPNQADPLGR